MILPEIVRAAIEGLETSQLSWRVRGRSRFARAPDAEAAPAIAEPAAVAAAVVAAATGTGAVAAVAAGLRYSSSSQVGAVADADEPSRRYYEDLSVYSEAG